MSANRAARRRAERDMRRLHADAAGVVALAIVRVGGGIEANDRFLISRWVAHMARGGSGFCLCCETDFQRLRNVPAAFMTLIPRRDDPNFGSVTGICARCASVSDAELGEAGLAFVRRGILPDARKLAPAHLHDEAGRA